MMSRDNMYDKCMISVFTCDAARNVYIQFRADVTDWGADELIQWFYFSVLLFSVFSFIEAFCILLLYCIVISVIIILLPNKDAYYTSLPIVVEWLAILSPAWSDNYEYIHCESKKLGHYFTAYNFRNIEQMFTKFGTNQSLFILNIVPDFLKSTLENSGAI